MLTEDFREAYIALLANDLKLRDGTGIPMLEVRLQYFDQSLMTELFLVGTEHIKVIVFISTCLFLLCSFLSAHLRQDMMVANLIVTDRDVTLVMRLNNSIRIEFVD